MKYARTPQTITYYDKSLIFEPEIEQETQQEVLTTTQPQETQTEYLNQQTTSTTQTDNEKD